MRIAWLGPIGPEGGVPGMGRTLLLGLLDLGVEIDYFTTETEPYIRNLLGHSDRLQVIQAPSWWQYDRWYSRKQFLAFLTSTYARTRAHTRLCDLLAERHKARRYDRVVQFSQIELLRLGKYLHQLPPVVVYCCVHAAGELKWHRKESAYARQSENPLMHYITRRILAFRAAKQRKEARKPAILIGMSKRFNELVEEDYGLDPARLRVLYHPITPPAHAADAPLVDRKVRLVFAGRISVRKGVEMLVELSKRLDDLANQVELEVIGGHTQWSDYRKHLSDLNPRVAKYLGGQQNAKLMETFSRSDILIAPSHYEPGGLVAGEAISRGMCVVASDEVGSAEPMEGTFVLKFKSGDMDAFERCTREMIARVRTDRPALAAAARRASAQQFDPPQIAAQLLTYLQEAK